MSYEYDESTEDILRDYLYRELNGKFPVVVCECAWNVAENGAVVPGKHPEFIVRVDQIKSLTLGAHGDVGCVDTGTQTPITRESYDRVREIWLKCSEVLSKCR